MGRTVKISLWVWLLEPFVIGLQQPRFFWMKRGFQLLLLLPALLLAACSPAPRPAPRTEPTAVQAILEPASISAPTPTPDAGRTDEAGWLYLRGEQPVQPGEAVTTLTLVGDINLGRNVPANALDELAPWLAAADLTLGNLECVLATRNLRLGRADQPYDLVAPPEALVSLQQAGFDLLNLANNHSLDLGVEGLLGTLKTLEKAGIQPTGIRNQGESTPQTGIKEINGLRFGFLAYNAIGSNPVGGITGDNTSPEMAGWEANTAMAEVAALKKQAQVVVVQMHWGEEYAPQPSAEQRRMAHTLLEAGADLVVGHHPHTIQEVQLQPQPDAPPQVVAYSLGNLVFDQEMQGTQDGLVLRAFFDAHGLRALQAVPVRAGPQPHRLKPELAAPILERLLAPQVVAFECSQAGCTPTSPREQARSGLFWSGMADLTGDGQPERIQLQSQQMLVFTQETQALAGVRAPESLLWSSQTEWQVLDLALGDPEGDGRTDVMLAMRKADPEGVLQSHPFLVGYRGGIFRTLWGGSAVAEPIYELELGDVDGDGIEELVVLDAPADEPAGSPQRMVSVWRWHGWGFSLQWRSPIAAYENLVFIPANGETPAQIQVTRAQ